MEIEKNRKIHELSGRRNKLMARNGEMQWFEISWCERQNRMVPGKREESEDDRFSLRRNVSEVTEVHP